MAQVTDALYIEIREKKGVLSMAFKLGMLLSILALAAVVLAGCGGRNSPVTTTPQVTSAAPITTPASPVASTAPAASTTPAPAQPVQIVSEEVNWNIEDTVVAATITRPDDKAVHPAIVFVAGSGPTDRDWNSPLLPGTNGSAKLLAEEMAKDGFVTIRYDKRFTGPYAQKNIPLLVGKISMESHLEELAGAVKVLASRADVDPARIFVIANSEGTIHALNYQAAGEPKFAGLILVGMPGRTMMEVVRSQLEAQVATLPDAEKIMAGFDKLMDDFLAGKPFAADPALPEGINTMVQGFYAPVNLPFTRELFALDPAPLLKTVTVPAMVMIGQKDIQVDYQLDGDVLEMAARDLRNVTFMYPENANHVLKNEPRPRSALTSADALTYNASDRVLDPGALQSIRDWLKSLK
jgi:pimeloyl-ACP methyl ester carboxylesterase